MLAGMAGGVDGEFELAFEKAANVYRHHFGNDHYVDLLPYNIPVVNEYAHWTSPITFVFLRTFFGRKDDRFSKGVSPLRAFDLRIARLNGIRMVVTDGDNIPGGELIYDTNAGDSKLRIFRIAAVNVGQFSPTAMHLVRSASEAIQKMQEASFTPERDVIVETPITKALVPAHSSTLAVDLGPTLVLKAQSNGTSLLVLPFEFSHCLQLESNSDANAHLVPVNLQQTGLIFERSIEARITYRFGLLKTNCRADDLRRADALQLRDAIRLPAPVRRFSFAESISRDNPF